MIARSAILFAGLAALPALAADISGNWKVTGDVIGNPVNAVCTFKQADAKITGTCKMANGADSPAAGEIKDKAITFHHDVDSQGATYTLTYTGKLQDDGSLKGNIEVAGVGGPFTATKQQP